MNSFRYASTQPETQNHQYNHVQKPLLLKKESINQILSKTDLPSKAPQLSKESITPEIAAYVVKEYLLPIFESDGKKLLKNKKQGTPEINEKDYESLTKGSNTVFSELKLSGILLDGINETK